MPSQPAKTTDAVLQHSTPHRTLSLPVYDVRLRRELAQRRLLLALSRQTLRVLLLHLLDASAIAVSALLSALITGFSGLREVGLPLLGVVLVGLNSRAAYRAEVVRGKLDRVLAGVVVAAVALFVFIALPLRVDLSFGFLACFVAVTAVALLVERRLLQLAVQHAHARGIGLSKAVIVGRHGEVREMIEALDSDDRRDHQVLGYVTPSRFHDDDALGTIDQIESILDRTQPEELIVAGTLQHEVLRRVAHACVSRGIAIFAVPSWGRAIRGWAEPVRVGRLPGYRVHPTRFAVPSLMLKRATDLTITSLGLVVAAPVIALVAVAIKIDSPGPVFYRQRRVGLGGREFMMWKFRSMASEADEDIEHIAHLNTYPDDRLFKAESDPRVTRVGRWLRRFSLDELPQLLNVLQGDMSLVGPRPPVPREVGRYEPHHYVRLSVVPGMTGPWQVNGRNLIKDFEQVVSLEKGYIDSWSLALDMRIMVKTVGVVLSGKGAY